MWKCKPYPRCVYQTDLILVYGVILYDPNVRDYIHTYRERVKRSETLRVRAMSDEASSDDAIDRFVDSSIDGGRVVP